MSEYVRRVLKYELDITDKQTIEMPEDADLLSIQEQGNKLVVWVGAVDGDEMGERTFYVVRTGEPLPEPDGNWSTSLFYCTTIQSKRNKSVWHVFTEIDFW